jgi:hypothetical protein
MASKEIENAVGREGTPARSVKPKSPLELLQEKRAALGAAHALYNAGKAARNEVGMGDATRLIASLTVLCFELEAEVAGAREQDAIQRAKERVLGISRAVGSVVASTVEDRERVLSAARDFAEAVNRLNERYQQYAGLAAEDAALRDRFGITGAKIPRVTSPDETANVIAAARVVEAVAYATDRISRPQTEKDEHGIRERRTYGEIGGTPAYAIIASAGPKAWPPLSERQQESIAALGREKEANSNLLGGEYALEATIAHALGTAGVPGGDVHRG